MRYTESNIPSHLTLRVYYETKLRDPESPHRWRTRAALFENATGYLVGYGTSECSRKDNPNRKIGRAIAVGRALKNYYQRIERPSRAAAA